MSDHALTMTGIGMMSNRFALTGQEAGVATIMLLPSYGYDHRIWGSFEALLAAETRTVAVGYPTRGPIDTVAVAEEAAAAISDEICVVASGDGAAGAVRLARQGRIRAMVLFSPFPYDAPAEYAEYAVDADVTDYGWAVDAASMTDPGERRRMIGRHQVRAFTGVVPDSDLSRLRKMFEDNADLILDPAARSTSGLAWFADLGQVVLPRTRRVDRPRWSPVGGDRPTAPARRPPTAGSHVHRGAVVVPTSRNRPAGAGFRAPGQRPAFAGSSSRVIRNSRSSSAMTTRRSSRRWLIAIRSSSSGTPSPSTS